MGLEIKEEPRYGNLARLILGLVVGIASIIPGLSGGVIAAALGLYEPAVRAIVNLRRDFKRSFFFLLPLGIGGIVGVLLFSRVMEYLFGQWSFFVTYAFLGLVIGSIPSLLHEANEQGFEKKYLIAAAITFSAVILLDTLASFAPQGGEGGSLAVVNLLLYGGILAFGTIIPGISSSFILMYLGVYEPLLTAIAHLDITILFWLAAGFVIAALLIIKIVDVLFRKFHGFAYYAVFGFLLGSMVMVFPGLRGGGAMVLDFLLLVASAVVTYIAMRFPGRQ